MVENCFWVGMEEEAEVENGSPASATAAAVFAAAAPRRRDVRSVDRLTTKGAMISCLVLIAMSMNQKVMSNVAEYGTFY